LRKRCTCREFHVETQPTRQYNESRKTVNRKDAKELAAAVDHIIMLYIAEIKK